MDTLDKVLRFTARCTVSDSDYFYSVFLDHGRYSLDSLNLFICRRMRKNSFIVQQISLFIKAYDLATGPEARVYGQHPFLPHWRSKEKLTEILSENSYGLNVSLFLGFFQNLIRDGRFKKPLVCIIKGKMQLLSQRRCRITPLLAEIIINLLAAFLCIRIYPHAYISLILSSEHSHHPVRCHPVKRFRIIKIYLVFLRLR